MEDSLYREGMEKEEKITRWGSFQNHTTNELRRRQVTALVAFVLGGLGTLVCGSHAVCDNVLLSVVGVVLQ